MKFRSRNHAISFSLSSFVLLAGVLFVPSWLKTRAQQNAPQPVMLKVSTTKVAGATEVDGDTLLYGNLKVYLPDDMAAGDTISGTVVAEPKGNTEEERSKNQDTLEGYVIELGNQRIPASQSTFTVKVPTAAPKKKPDFALTIIDGASNKSAGSTLLPVLPTFEVHLTTPLNNFDLPAIGQPGRGVEVVGPFDGDSQNTTLHWTKVGVQDFEKNTENVSGGFGLIDGKPVAESPRKAVFIAPKNVTGPIELHLQEGNKQATGTFRNIGVNLSAPKTNLLKGERTTLTVEVNGLQGIKKPVPLTLESRGVITMEGGMYQPLIIQPSQISAGGTYTTTRGITGVQTGGWTATATVVTQPFNIILRDPDPPQTVLINSFTGDYIFCGSGQKLSGTGEIKQQGCVFTLIYITPDRQINGTFNGCAPVDNSRFSVFFSAGASTDVKLAVTDTQPKRTRVYFNPLNRPMPLVQDVSAFATCP